jgi:dCTP diphosphatase
MNNQLTREDLIERLVNFVRARNWEQFHSPKNLAASISIEAAELLELFQWATDTQVQELNPVELEKIGDEVADIYFYLLLFCRRLNLDLHALALRKLEKNDKKYPIEKSFGKSTKYTEFDENSSG